MCPHEQKWSELLLPVEETFKCMLSKPLKTCIRLPWSSQRFDKRKGNEGDEREEFQDSEERQVITVIIKRTQESVCCSRKWTDLGPVFTICHFHSPDHIIRPEGSSVCTTGRKHVPLRATWRMKWVGWHLAQHVNTGHCRCRWRCYSCCCGAPSSSKASRSTVSHQHFARFYSLLTYNHSIAELKGSLEFFFDTFMNRERKALKIQQLIQKHESGSTDYVATARTWA